MLQRSLRGSGELCGCSNFNGIHIYREKFNLNGVEFRSENVQNSRLYMKIDSKEIHFSSYVYAKLSERVRRESTRASKIPYNSPKTNEKPAKAHKARKTSPRCLALPPEAALKE